MLTKLSADTVVIFSKEGSLMNNASASISCNVGVRNHSEGTCVTAWLSLQAAEEWEHWLVGFAYQIRPLHLCNDLCSIRSDVQL